MNEILLTYFAFPIAIIILSIILEELLNSPIRVAGIAFSIFIVLTFSLFTIEFLIATLVYTLLAFLVAYIVNIMLNRKDRFQSIERLVTTNNEILNGNLINNNENTIINNRDINNCGYYARNRFGRL